MTSAQGQSITQTSTEPTNEATSAPTNTVHIEGEIHEGDMSQFVLDVLLGGEEDDDDRVCEEKMVAMESRKLSLTQADMDMAYQSSPAVLFAPRQLSSEGPTLKRLSESTEMLNWTNDDHHRHPASHPTHPYVGSLKQTHITHRMVVQSATPSAANFNRSTSYTAVTSGHLPGTSTPGANRLPPSAIDANTMADLLGVGPKYRLQEKERWSSAAATYQEMISRGNTPDHSPPGGRAITITAKGRTDTEDITPTLASTSASKPINILGVAATLTPQNTPTMRQLLTHPIATESADGPNGGDSSGNAIHTVPSTSNVATLAGTLTPHQVLAGVCRSGMMSRSDSRADASIPNSLELEAIAAVHELSFAVEQIAVSEMLPRTPELIFVNVTTVEGKPFCVELSFNGWRVTSNRHDCMMGDWQRLDLHAKYFDTVYALMDTISVGYRHRFGDKLTEKLQVLATSRSTEEADGEDPIVHSSSHLDVNPRTSPPSTAALPTISVRHPSGQLRQTSPSITLVTKRDYNGATE